MGGKCPFWLFVVTVLVLAVEYMTLMDVGSAFVQMQCPVQQMNMSAEALMKFGHKLCHH